VKHSGVRRGLPGIIGERIGLPPDWTDQGAASNAASQAPVTD
jgi:hypothetical protein